MLQLKRWLLLSIAALTIASLGLGLILADLYRVQPFPESAYYLTLQFVPRFTRGLLLLIVGLALGTLGGYHLARRVVESLLPDSSRSPIDSAVERFHLQAGSRVVAIGGGTGLSTLLRGLKEVTANITAIVTVADDGGSSGRLRRDMGILPPGDFRQCLVALADAEPLMRHLVEHRFQSPGELHGHSFGNLLLAAMTEITGSLDRAVEECSRVLAVRGRIIPATLTEITLCAELEDGRVVRGESAIGHAGSPIRHVFLDPPTASAYPEAVRAILAADAVILGPGSLYTSILPNLLVHDLARALQVTKARKIYVCNVANEPGETAGFAVGDFVRAIREHVGNVTVEHILANNNLEPCGDLKVGVGRKVELVRMGGGGLVESSFRVHSADVISEENPVRHDPHKLASALVQVGLG